MINKILKYLVYAAVASSLAFGGLAFAQDIGYELVDEPGHARGPSEKKGWKIIQKKGDPNFGKWQRPKESDTFGGKGNEPATPTPGPITKPPAGTIPGTTDPITKKVSGSQTFQVNGLEIKRELTALVNPKKPKECNPKIEIFLQTLTEEKDGLPPPGPYLVITNNCGFIAFIPVKEGKSKELEKVLPLMLTDMNKKGGPSSAVINEWWDIIGGFLDSGKLKYYYQIEKPDAASVNKARENLGLPKLLSFLPSTEIAPKSEYVIAVSSNQRLQLSAKNNALVTITVTADVINSSTGDTAKLVGNIKKLLRGGINYIIRFAFPPGVTPIDAPIVTINNQDSDFGVSVATVRVLPTECPPSKPQPPEYNRADTPAERDKKSKDYSKALKEWTEKAYPPSKPGCPWDGLGIPKTPFN